MKKSLPILMITMIIISTSFFYLYTKQGPLPMYADIKTLSDIQRIFPRSAHVIASEVDRAITQSREAIESFLAIKDEDRTFENTAQKLDEIYGLSNLSILGTIISILEMTSPDESIRKAAHEAIIKIQDFTVAELSNNVDIFKAFKAYIEQKSHAEQLTEKQRYFLTETLDGFKRAGLGLPLEQLEEVKTIKKEIAALILDFDTNIAADQTKVIIAPADLAGLPEDFIAAFERDENGNCKVGVDSPTFYKIAQNCSVAETRKKMSQAYLNRAYPKNEALLKEIIAKRDLLAKKLGKASYAELDLEDQMVKTPQHAHDFLHDLLAKVKTKVEQEFKLITSDLPESVILQNGKMFPWDGAYVANEYKKKHLQIDELKIAEYFPLETTVKGLLSIYEKFFSLRFEQKQVKNLWHDEVSALEVYSTLDNSFLGYFLLDLFPRPFKYSHACHCTIIPSTYGPQGEIKPALSVVIANFPRAIGDKPALLERCHVSTFFHEFGHALHALLGRTSLATQSGTSVKTDFVEMPSQMLEEWLEEKEILAMVSSHYQTGEPLSDDLIKKIMDLKRFDAGSFVQTQAYYALISLNIHAPGADKDVYGIMKELYTTLRPHMVFDSENHMYASFGHLTGYGAKYYGYLWSKVFALDLFAQIKKMGLLNPAVGEKYVAEVIGQGGSIDPNDVLENFLGRKPNQSAFLADLGLK